MEKMIDRTSQSQSSLLKTLFLVLILSIFSTNASNQFFDEILSNSGTNMLKREVSNQKDQVKVLNQTYDIKRPVIHTFLYVGDDDKSSHRTLRLNDTSIITWAHAWADQGWEPIVLTEKDASRHPDFKKYVNKMSLIGILPSRKRYFLRYLAMASVRGDGGWYADPNVYPIKHADNFHERGFHLPNLGNFTIHDSVNLPSIMSANKQEWNRISSHIMNDNRRNDALILKVLNQNYPGFYIEAPSIMEFKDIFNSSSLCNQLENKIATKVSTGVRVLGFSNHIAYHKAVKNALDKCKPTIHTFFEMAYHSGLNEHTTLLTEWEKAWKEAGWNPVILTLNDAKKHPAFKAFGQAFEKASYKTSQYDQMCFYRWLAMATLDDGGYMSDYDTFPLQVRNKIMKSQSLSSSDNLPNNGAFTSNQRHVPCFLSGSKQEWNRMVSLIYENYKSHTTHFWSDMLAIDNIYYLQKAYIQTNEAIDLYNVYSNPPFHLKKRHTYNDGSWVDLDSAYNKPMESLHKFCHSTDDKLVVHFSHDACHRVGFCHRVRGSNLNEWLKAWLNQCYYTYT